LARARRRKAYAFLLGLSGGQADLPLRHRQPVTNPSKQHVRALIANIPRRNATYAVVCRRDGRRTGVVCDDSVPGFGWAQRRSAWPRRAASQKGYTPSVFALLPNLNAPATSERGRLPLLHRAVEGTTSTSPFATRPAEYGRHFILSRDLASAGHYRRRHSQSVSRLSNKCITRKNSRRTACPRGSGNFQQSAV